jgi:predicted TIM-barrel fold metal-dependent hydrolase
MLRELGFRAVMLVAGIFGWTLANYAVHALAREAAAAKMPVQFCLRDARDLALAAEAAGPPGGPAMIRWMRGGGYVILPDLLAIGREFPNLLIDVGTITQRGAIDHMAARLGPERLFVASNLPQSHAGAAWFLFAASDLDAEAKRLVGGGNLARVLGLPAPRSAPEPADFMALAERPKIDTHWHTSGWNVIETKITFDDLSAAIRRYNMRAVVTSSIRALSDDLSAGNRETADFLDREPRARGLIVVNPLEPALSLAEIERWRADPRFVGIKTIQDFYGLSLDSPRYRPILERLAEIPDMPMMAHLPGMKKAAEAHPRVQFAAAHSTWNHHELAPLTNVWFDIATATPLERESDIADLIAAVGPGRVIFSSDAPLLDPAFTLGKLALLDLAPDALEGIFNRNALRAFPRLQSSFPS